MPELQTLQKRLMTIYDRLSPLHRFLMQLCSVIYEKTTASSIYHCLKSTGRTFAGEPLTAPAQLAPHLRELQQLKLLDRHFRCHEAIVELVTRSALTSPSTLLPQDLLQIAANATNWSQEKLSGQRCISCYTDLSGAALQTSCGPLCEACVVSELKLMAAQEDLTTWADAQFAQALSPGADPQRRLTVIWRFAEIYPRLTGKNPAGADDLMLLLIQQMGFIEPVPLAHAVRQAAIEAAVSLGGNILPLLLATTATVPWQLYVNVLLAAVYIAPQNKEVCKRREQAGRDPRAEVRKWLPSLQSQVDSRRFKGPARYSDFGFETTASKPLHSLMSRLADRLGKTAAKPSSNLSALSLFRTMARAVRERLPMHVHYFDDPTLQCQRIMRDLRIGLYTGNMDLCLKSREILFAYCPDRSFTQSDPFSRVLMNPFDPEWLATLSSRFQANLLGAIFDSAAQKLEPIGELLAYALEEDFITNLPYPENLLLCRELIANLLLAGRLPDAQKLIQTTPPNDPTVAGLRGWLYFIQGKNDAAMQAFQEDAALWRKELKRRTGCFSGLPGLFYLLALLRSDGESDWREIEQVLASARQAHSKTSFYWSIYEFFRAVAEVKKGHQEEARQLVEQGPQGNGVAIFFRAFAAYVVDGSLNQKTIDELSELFVRTREIGLNWLAMETAELLCRTEQRTPIRENFIRLVQGETGMQSFLPFIKVEEGWRKGLRFLQSITNLEETTGGRRNPDMRLAWFLSVNGSTISLVPKEQKISVKGGWTKGRVVPFFRLLDGGKSLDSASNKDKEVLAAFEQNTHYFYDAKWNLEKGLPALVGHPLVFLEGSPEVPIEIVRGEPEIIVTQSGPSLNISLTPAPLKQGVVLLRETPTRFKVVQFSDAHLRMAALLGEDGLSVPLAGKEEVAAVITSLSSLVTVHSAIGGAAENIEVVAADPTPHIHLMPVGGGFRAEMFVKPFAGQGPYLKPGIGAANLIADVDGKRMQAQRDLKLEREKAAVVEAECPILAGFSEAERSWLLQDPEHCLQVLIDVKPLQERGDLLVEWPEGEKLKLLRIASFDQLRMQIRGKTNWFEVSGQLRVDDNLVLDMRELLDMMQTTSSRFVPLGEGQYIALTQELRKRLEELDAYAEKKGKALGVHPLAALALEDLTGQLAHLETDMVWQQTLDRIRSTQAVIPLVPSTFKGQLRDYQLDGYRWLSRLAHMGTGACLADDMGLGKTIQALAIILERAPLGPSLVVAPTSVCMNWLTEASRFAPTLNVRQLVGGNREKVVKDLAAHDLLVTSYGLLYQEAELLASVQWNVIVLDEAQAIKNITTKRAQAAMNLDGGFKIITTGTPIENHLGELWTLFNFINPGLLGSHKRFNERFALPIEKYNDRNVQKRLKKLIQPFILRRTKAQVLEELPPRTDVLLRVEMSAQEAAFYEALRRQSLERIEADHAPMFQKQLKILAEIMRLRQAACNPRLVIPDSGVPSGKLDLFGEIVTELLENGHKALVFSQFVGHLALIRQFLDGKGIDYRYLDGSTPPAERKKEVDAFQSGQGDLFLISLKAGGLGLNLTAADYVIHMDPWWNPAVEDQASDRTHRIGQQRPVTVYRLVTEGTIEEKIVKLHQDKRDLAGSLLEGSDMSGKISAEELLQLIREQ